MADLQRQRLRGLGQRRHARREGCDGSDPARLAGSPLSRASLQPRLALGDARRHLRERDRRRVERQRQRGDVEVAGGEDRVVVGEHQRVVGGAGELGLERLGEHAAAPTRSEPWTWLAQRKLSGSCRRRAAPGSVSAPPRQQRAQTRGRPPLTGSGPRGDHARVERAQVGAKPLHRERGRDLGGAQPGLGVDAGPARAAPTDTAELEQIASPSLAPSATGARPARSSASRRRQPLAVELGVPLADQRQPDVGHQAQVGRADRAAARDRRMNAGVEQRGQPVGHRLAGARAAGAEPVEADDHRRAGELAAERLADRGRAPAQRAQRELGRLGAVDGSTHPRDPSPVVTPYTGRAGRGRPSDRRRGLADPLAGVGARSSPAPRRGRLPRPASGSEIVSGDDDRRHGPTIHGSPDRSPLRLPPAFRAPGRCLRAPRHGRRRPRPSPRAGPAPVTLDGATLTPKAVALIAREGAEARLSAEAREPQRRAPARRSPRCWPAATSCTA